MTPVPRRLARVLGVLVVLVTAVSLALTAFKGDLHPHGSQDRHKRARRPAPTPAPAPAPTLPHVRRQHEREAQGQREQDGAKRTAAESSLKDVEEESWDSGLWLHVPVESVSAAIPTLTALNRAAHPTETIHIRFHLLSEPGTAGIKPPRFAHGTAAFRSLHSLSMLVSCGARVEATPGSQHAGTVYKVLEESWPACRSVTPGNHFLFLPGAAPGLAEDVLRNAVALIQHFFRPTPAVETLAGVSLGSPTFEQHTMGYRPVHPKPPRTHVFYTLQHPQTEGGLYHLPAIAQYLRWYEARCQVLKPLPCGEGVAPAAMQHFEKGLFHMMTEAKLTLVYPPLDWQHALLYSTKSQGHGAQLPLNSPARGVSFNDLQHTLQHVDASVLPVLNARRGHLHDGPAKLYARDTELLGRCTMIITVYDRYEQLLNRLLFYHTSLNLRSIVVVWNAITHTPPLIPPQDFYIPIDILPQRVNSMNNRFKPLRAGELSVPPADCIVNMDDDWNMPHQVLFHSVRLWHHLHRQQLVGLWKLGRLHGQAEGGGDWVYLKNATAPQSIVLPSGMVYHARYLRLYTEQIPARLREHVDRVTNCDDLLINFAVANATKQPPVFVATQGVQRVRVLKQLGLDQGLWRRSKHYEDRDACLNLFSEAYGGMPLRYTTLQYRIDDHLGNAFPQPLPSKADNAATQSVKCVVYKQQKCVDDCITCDIAT